MHLQPVLPLQHSVMLPLPETAFIAMPLLLHALLTHTIDDALLTAAVLARGVAALQSLGDMRVEIVGRHGHASVALEVARLRFATRSPCWSIWWWHVG